MRERSRGFTLIEVMVVLVLIGIILGLAVLSIGNDRGKQLETEARRLAVLVDLAGEEAVLQSRELGLRFEPEGYRFMVIGKEGWEPLTDDLLRPRTLPGAIQPQLLLEGLPVSLEQRGGDEELKPHIVFFSSGERIPFELLFKTEDGEMVWKLEAPLIGEVSVSGAAV